MLKANTVARIMLLTASMAANPLIASADPTWPELFKEAALPKDVGSIKSLGYVVEMIDLTDIDQKGLKYRVDLPTDSTPTVTVETYPTDADKEEIDKDLNSNVEGDIWCDNQNDKVGGPVKLVSETDNEAVYSFPANPKNAEDKKERKLLEKSIITVTIDKTKREVTKFSTELMEPFKPMVIAKVNNFKMDAICQSTSFGRPVLSSVSITLSGKAMGKNFSQNTKQSFTDIQID